MSFEFAFITLQPKLCRDHESELCREEKKKRIRPVCLPEKRQEGRGRRRNLLPGWRIIVGSLSPHRCCASQDARPRRGTQKPTAIPGGRTTWASPRGRQPATRQRLCESRSAVSEVISREGIGHWGGRGGRGGREKGMKRGEEGGGMCGGRRGELQSGMVEGAGGDRLTKRKRIK